MLLIFRNPFSLLSVYSHYKRSDGLPEVTTQHAKESTTVDYIFYSVRHKSARWTDDGHLRIRDVEEGKLRLLERYSLLSQQDISRSCGDLPNQFCSSDHLPLIAKFELLLD